MEQELLRLPLFSPSCSSLFLWHVRPDCGPTFRMAFFPSRFPTEPPISPSSTTPMWMGLAFVQAGAALSPQKESSIGPLSTQKWQEQRQLARKCCCASVRRLENRIGSPK